MYEHNVSVITFEEFVSFAKYQLGTKRENLNNLTWPQTSIKQFTNCQKKVPKIAQFLYVIIIRYCNKWNDVVNIKLHRK